MDLEINGKAAYAYTGGKAFDNSLPTVVLIHGGAHDHSVWALQSRWLAHHGFGVLAVDLPGHGRSDGPALGRIEDIADWIVSLLDAAAVTKAALAGHSMGSLVALDCAARHPGRAASLALIGTAVPMKVSPELLASTMTDEAGAQAMINVWSHAALSHYPGNPGPGASVLGGNLRLLQRQKPGVLHTDFAACNNYAAGMERAAQILCPTLVVLAGADLMTSPRSGRALAAAINGSKTVTVPGSGHALMAEKPDAVLDALAEFLRPLTAPAASSA